MMIFCSRSSSRRRIFSTSATRWLWALSCSYQSPRGSWVALKGRVPREAVEATYRGQYAKLPGARVVMSDTARHFIMWDDPEVFFRELDGFLGTHASVARVEPRR